MKVDIFVKMAEVAEEVQRTEEAFRKIMNKSPSGDLGAKEAKSIGHRASGSVADTAAQLSKRIQPIAQHL